MPLLQVKHLLIRAARPVAQAETPPTTREQSQAHWLLIAGGLLALYVPTLVDLFRGLWGATEQGHGPIVLAVSIFLLYRQWPAMMAAGAHSRPHSAGWVLVTIGLLLYVIGRSQDILIFEVGSVLWILSGLILLFVGSAGLKAQWFPLFFLIFMVPLPGPVVDS